ncbi:hypothetical protein WIS52_19000 [Pseudonocardia nematodicida]|uniref:Uncharacterized protein n=1 Tax=Pseudonocardia nematodicida TaxID=1206997 RepID=A0ABV1KDN1_9PSEU
MRTTGWWVPRGGVVGAGPAAALTLTVLLALPACGARIEGTAWPEGQGPAVPPGAATTAAPAPEGPPTSFRVPGAPAAGSPELGGPATGDPESGPGPTGAPDGPSPRDGAQRDGAQDTGDTGPADGEPAGDEAADGGERADDPSSGGRGPDSSTGTPAPERSPAGPAAPDPPAPGTSGEPTRVVPPIPVGSSPGKAPAPRTPTAPATPPPLTADVVDDECLLDDAALTGLLGAAPDAPAANGVVARPDGTRIRACFAAGGPATVSVNVYAANRGTPAERVRAAAGARPLSGTADGTVAALLDTVAGTALQVGTARHLITVAVDGHAPSDEAWRTAARAAVARLAGR